jgi:YggT family protein
VPTFIAGMDAFLRILRVTLFVAVLVIAVICLLDWLVRTKRINPFSPISRFMRSSVDPLMVPVERRIVNAGGLPTSAPWWALVFAVIASIILITVLGFIRSQIIAISMSSSAGIGGLFYLLVRWTFGILQIAIIVRVISSWIRVSPYSPWIRWSFVLTEPILRPLRQIIPTIGVIDITPIVAYILLRLLEGLVLGALRGG